MKAKKSPGRRNRRNTTREVDSPQARQRAVILDFVQSRIEAFNVEHGGGVAVRKDPHGYTLTRVDEGMPVARLRPRNEGLFEILYWSPYHERWRPVGSFGTVLDLDDALDFIAEDPMDCFWR